jgi:hypothetical protein
MDVGRGELDAAATLSWRNKETSFRRALPIQDHYSYYVSPCFVLQNIAFRIFAIIKAYLPSPPRFNHAAGAQGDLDAFSGLPLSIFLPFVIPTAGLEFRDLLIIHLDSSSISLVLVETYYN